MTEKTESKWNKAQRLANQGLTVRQIKDQGIGTTYAKRAVRQFETKKAGTEKPTIEPIEKVKASAELHEEPVESSLRDELEKAEKEYVEEETGKPIVEKPAEGEEAKAEPIVDAEYLAKLFWDGVNTFLPEKRQKPLKSINYLVTATVPVINKYAPNIEKELPVELAMLIAVVIVFIPEIKDYAVPQIQKALGSLNQLVRRQKPEQKNV